MRRVFADFRRPAVPQRLLWWSVALFGVLGGAAGFAAWTKWQEVKVQREALAGAGTAKAFIPVAMLPPPTTSPYDASARVLLAERASPWPQALSMIEATSIVGVTPVAVEFTANEASVRVEIAFVDYAKLLEYVDMLNAGEPELTWALSQSQAQAPGAATATLVGRPLHR